MKSVRTLRLLSLLGFLLLIAPFYDQCNGHGMRKSEAPVEVPAVDTTAVDSPESKINNSNEVNDVENDSIVNVEKSETPFYQKAYEFIDDNDNQNAFELAEISTAYFEGPFSKFKEELFKDLKKHKYDGLSLPIRSFSFVFIVFITFLMLILSCLKRIKWVYKLSIANISFVIITLICILFFDSLFETYKQIKWGYYAFTLVQIGIWYTSKIKITTPNSN